MNVSILAFVVFWTMRRLRFSDFAASGLTVVLCAAYAFVTDVGPPVWRAVLMLSVYLVVRLFYRERSMLNALGVAALVVMVVDPRALLGTKLSAHISGGVHPCRDRCAGSGTNFATLPARTAASGFDRFRPHAPATGGADAARFATDCGTAGPDRRSDVRPTSARG